MTTYVVVRNSRPTGDDPVTRPGVPALDIYDRRGPQAKAGLVHTDAPERG